MVFEVSAPEEEAHTLVAPCWLVYQLSSVDIGDAHGAPHHSSVLSQVAATDHGALLH